MKLLNFAVGLFLGALIWAQSINLTGHREPFDGNMVIYLGLLFVAGMISSLPSPRFWWLGSIGVYAGQYAYTFLVNGPGNMWPVALVFGAVMSGVAALGGLTVFCSCEKLERSPGVD